MDLRNNYSLQPRVSRSLSLTKEDKEFIARLSKSIVKRQCENFVISPFPLVSLVILSESRIELKGLIHGFQKNETLFYLSELIEKCITLSSFLALENLSFSVLDKSFETSLEETFSVHNNLVEYASERKYVKVNLSDPITVLKFRHYANQSLHFFVDIAICLATLSSDEFFKLRKILSREFIYIEDELDYALIYESAQQVKGPVKDILMQQVNIFLTIYYTIAGWLLSNTRNSSLKNFVKLIQKNIAVSSDTIQNFLQLLIDRNVLISTKSDVYNIEDEAKLFAVYQEIGELLQSFYDDEDALNTNIFKAKL